MSCIQFQPRQFLRVSSRLILLVLAICGCLVLTEVSASAHLAANQTNGFGSGRLVTFTYLQNFDCVDQPTMDLDFRGWGGPRSGSPASTYCRHRRRHLSVATWYVASDCRSRWHHATTYLGPNCSGLRARRWQRHCTKPV